MRATTFLFSLLALGNAAFAHHSEERHADRQHAAVRRADASTPSSSSASAPITSAALMQAESLAAIPKEAHLVFNPTVYLDVIFPQANGSLVQLATAGSTLTEAETGVVPEFAISSNASSLTGFVVIAVDLDAPFRTAPVLAQWLHFMGGAFMPEPTADLSPNSDVVMLSSSVKPVMTWENPDPQGTEPHRYVFLLWEQSPQFCSQNIVKPNQSRALFNVSKFAEEVGLGNPIGGTFMLVAA
ncbi:PEBP-like protein [Obba rivulosa]|uniref:PEBP-like protein n=1 Tax=Obba rivulosa TaxID=1052685 RepID=A0A8E2DMK7_9APHY|nr:PEBP-like protein [Obba rivulosa]